MRKKELIALILIFLSNLSFGQTYSRQEIFEDLTFLKSQLEERHPNINIYTKKSEFNAFFQNISIPDSLSSIEAYSTIASSNNVIKDGHTLFHPNQDLTSSNNQTGLFLPVQPYWDGEKLFVLNNYSSSKELTSGQEIVSINGLKSTVLIQEMLDKLMRDGNNFNYPKWVLNTYFFEYYSYFYGCNKEYEFVLKENEKRIHLKIQGILKTELFQNIKKTNENNEKGISLEVDIEKNTALLTIKDWHTSTLRKYYKQKFIPELKRIIQQIENNNIENLIIDVRDNQGGDLKNSKYLLSYLLNEPFSLVEEYNKKKKGEIVKTKGPQMGIHKPLPNSFKGTVYVLTNGGSFSNTSIFCSALKRHKRATLIGEETGGSEFIICGIPKTTKLPNTGITIELPRLQFLIKTNTDQEMHGIIPDVEIKPTIKNLINGKDAVIEYTMKLIE